MSSVAVSFKLRKLKCRIEKEKKMEVKLIAKIDIIHNRNVYCWRRFDQKFERHLPDYNHVSLSDQTYLCDENAHLKDVA